MTIYIYPNTIRPLKLNQKKKKEKILTKSIIHILLKKKNLK